MPRLSALACIIFLAASFLLAHEARLHGAHAFFGEATAVSDSGFQLKTKTGTLKVNYTSKTKFERAAKPATKMDLKPGVKVGVAGSKLPDGAVAANLVLIDYVDPPASSAAAQKKTGHHHDGKH